MIVNHQQETLCNSTYRRRGVCDRITYNLLTFGCYDRSVTDVISHVVDKNCPLFVYRDNHFLSRLSIRQHGKDGKDGEDDGRRTKIWC